MVDRPLILITNDDGIASHGLREAIHAVYDLADILVVAPLTQQTAAGRSFPPRDIRIEEYELSLENGAVVPALALTGTPAQAVRQAILVNAERPPDLCISGINYGENVGTGVSISGTIGATIEAASFGIPSLAASLETDVQHHLTNSTVVDFSAASYFVRCLTQAMLKNGLPAGVDIFKLDVPCDATSATPWRITRVSRQRSVHSAVTEENGIKRLHGYYREFDLDTLEPDSDAYALIVDEVVSISPLTIDMTADVNVSLLEESLDVLFPAMNSRA